MVERRTEHSFQVFSGSLSLFVFFSFLVCVRKYSLPCNLANMEKYTLVITQWRIQVGWGALGASANVLY